MRWLASRRVWFFWCFLVKFLKTTKSTNKIENQKNRQISKQLWNGNRHSGEFQSLLWVEDPAPSILYPALASNSQVCLLSSLSNFRHKIAENSLTIWIWTFTSNYLAKCLNNCTFVEELNAVHYLCHFSIKSAFLSSHLGFPFSKSASMNKTKGFASYWLNTWHGYCRWHD